MVKCSECQDKSDFAGCCAKHALDKIEKSVEDTRLLRVEEASDGKHKYVAVFEKNGREKRVSFGAEGYHDFILWNKENKKLALERRDLYWERHLKDFKTHDVTSPGYLSLFILWNKPTLDASIKDYKRRFNL